MEEIELRIATAEERARGVGGNDLGSRLREPSRDIRVLEHGSERVRLLGKRLRMMSHGLGVTIPVGATWVKSKDIFCNTTAHQLNTAHERAIRLTTRTDLNEPDTHSCGVTDGVL